MPSQREILTVGEKDGMMAWLVSVCLVLVFVFPSFVAACENIQGMDLKETVALADVIVVGKEELEGPSLPQEFPYTGGPEWIDLRIERVLKGQISDGLIRVATNGPCGYGLVSRGNGVRSLFLLNRKGAGYGVVLSPDGARRGVDPLVILEDGQLQEGTDAAALLKTDTEKNPGGRTVDDFVREFHLAR